ncbi:MAG: peptidylprolyl isomerase [Pseudomonadota bacterium]
MKRTLRVAIHSTWFCLAAGVAVHAAEAPAPGVFARVGEQVITQDDYSAALAAAARAKFYHGKPPEQEMALLQRSVGDQLVERVLLQNEARRRAIRPDAQAIEKQVQGYEKRYAGSAQWQQNKASMLPPLVARLEQESVLAQLEAGVRSNTVSPAQARAYYAAHQDKFTEPEQWHVGLILFKVEPSAPTEEWVRIDAQAQAVALRARAGEDFGALARQYSADASAAKGGDMGYLHVGMLPEGTQKALAALADGGVSDSLRLLQGLGVFRLVERKPARLQGFDAVAQRAAELAQREQGDRNWSALLLQLRAQTPAQLDTSRFLPLAGAPEAGAAAK